MKHESYRFRMSKQEKTLIDNLNSLIDKSNEIEKQSKAIKKLMNKMQGKSKVDLFFEKKFSTPRKIKLLQNKAIQTPTNKFYEDLDMNKIQETVVFYLKKYESIKS